MSFGIASLEELSKVEAASSSLFDILNQLQSQLAPTKKARWECNLSKRFSEAEKLAKKAVEQLVLQSMCVSTLKQKIVGGAEDTEHALSIFEAELRRKEEACLDSEQSLAAVQVKFDNLKKDMQQSEQKHNMLQHIMLSSKASRLAAEAQELGELGVDHLEMLKSILCQQGEVRRIQSEVQKRWEIQLNEVEAQIRCNQEKCVICMEAFCRGDRVLSLPCCHVFHDDCLMPRLRDGTVTKCPIDRADIPRSIVDQLTIWVWDGKLSGPTC